MGQLIVRNVAEGLIHALKVRAAQKQRSAEAEHREILREALITVRRKQKTLKDALLAIPQVGDDADFERERSRPEDPAVSVLVDTNVIAELRKGTRTNANVRAWFARLETGEIWLSVVTIGEIRKGIESVRRRDAASAAALERWLRRLVTEHADHILPIDLPITEEWGRLNVPNPLPVIDGLLAATAKVHGLIVATRNVKDIVRAGVEVVNPFERATA